MNLMKMPLQKFVGFLKENKIRRFYFVYDAEKKRCIASHEILQPIADALTKDKRDYQQHEGIFCQVTKKYDSLQGAFIHRTNRGQGAGGTRFWQYKTLADFLQDGTRLAMGMTHKNALAGLWWGGGKGVMAHNPEYDKQDPKLRTAMFHAYGELITSLNGCYITAEDVGTNTSDIGKIFAKTRFVTCIPQKVGGSGNPSVITAKGVVRGMEAAVKFFDGSTLKDKTVAVQGVGNVGSPLIEFLFEKKVGKVIACDIDSELVANVKKKFAGENLEVKTVKINDLSLLARKCDILAPCATGGVLNSKTISKIKAKIVCGAANNQLEDPIKDDQRLFERGILYLPDFLVNRMGIVNCANEQYGYVDNDPFLEKHLDKRWKYSVYQMSLKILQRAKKNKETPGRAAVAMAEELSLENHPIFGHRGLQIIESLVNSEWVNS